MKVDYDSMVLTEKQEACYAKTIELNPFIPGNDLLETKLYDLQIYALLYFSNTITIYDFPFLDSRRVIESCTVLKLH